MPVPPVAAGSVVESETPTVPSMENSVTLNAGLLAGAAEITMRTVMVALSPSLSVAV